MYLEGVQIIRIFIIKIENLQKFKLCQRLFFLILKCVDMGSSKEHKFSEKELVILCEEEWIIPK